MYVSYVMIYMCVLYIYADINIHTQTNRHTDAQHRTYRISETPPVLSSFDRNSAGLVIIRQKLRRSCHHFFAAADEILLCVCMFVCMNVCMNEFTSVYMYIFMIYIYIYTHTYIHTYMNTYIHTHTHKRTHIETSATHVYNGFKSRHLRKLQSKISRNSNINVK